jgi:HAD superfamily hydrolase (TIGR01509 family)
MRMPIRALIFDLMDVLLCVEDRAAWRTWEADAGKVEGTLAHAMFQSPLFREAIAGRVPETELWRDVARTLMVDAEPESLAAVFSSGLRLNIRLVEFIRTLRPRCKVAVLTNTPSDMRILLARRFQLDQEVDTIIISSEEGVGKPQPELFQRALDRLGVQAQETLFVDAPKSLTSRALWGYA